MTFETPDSCEEKTVRLEQGSAMQTCSITASFTTEPAASSASILSITCCTSGMISSGIGLAPFLPTATFFIASLKGCKSDSLFRAGNPEMPDAVTLFTLKRWLRPLRSTVAVCVPLCRATVGRLPKAAREQS
eukprot:1181208-Prorocentrum_minimum.AAC.1